MTKNKMLSSKEIVEYALRIDQIGSTLNEGLLLEALDQAAALKISQANDELVGMLQELDRAFSDKIPAVSTEIEKLLGAANKSSNILKKLVKGSDSKLTSKKLMSKIASFFAGKVDPKAVMNSILLLQSRAQELVEILKFAMPKIVKQLENVNVTKADSRKMHEVLGANQSMVEMALKDLLKKSKPGFFKSAGNIFKTMNADKNILDINDKINYDAIAKEMSEIKISDFYSVYEGTAKIKTDGGSGLKDIIKTADLKPTSGEEEGSATGNQATSSEEPAPESSPKEAKKEVEAASSELKAAAKVAVKTSKPPAVAMGDALDQWAKGLSKSSQASLQQKNRLSDLKDIVGVALEDAAKAVESEVKAAVQAWREEHEETLMKSKRFAKKNFDNLESIIPQIASVMLKKTSEAKKSLTKEMVHKSVFSHLNKMFNTEKILVENKESAISSPMLEIARLLKEISESDVRDGRGKIVVEPGLKVRHKKSGLEYSVQKVETEDEKVKISLAVPEMPRVDSTKTFPSVVTEKEDAKSLDDLIDAAEHHQETIFIVDEKEFEKDYEVK